MALAERCRPEPWNITGSRTTRTNPVSTKSTSSRFGVASSKLSKLLSLAEWEVNRARSSGLRGRRLAADDGGDQGCLVPAFECPCSRGHFGEERAKREEGRPTSDRTRDASG